MSVVISFKKGMYRIIEDDKYEYIVIDEDDEELARARRAIVQHMAERDLMMEAELDE